MAVKSALRGSQLSTHAPMVGSFRNGDQGYHRQDRHSAHDPYADIRHCDPTKSERGYSKTELRSMKRKERSAIRLQLKNAAFELPDRMDDAEDLDGYWFN